MYKYVTVVITKDSEGHPQGVLINDEQSRGLSYCRARTEELIEVRSMLDELLRKDTTNSSRLNGTISDDQSTVTNVT
jgi:hypothetical protein